MLHSFAAAKASQHFQRIFSFFFWAFQNLHSSSAISAIQRLCEVKPHEPVSKCTNNPTNPSSSLVRHTWRQSLTPRGSLALIKGLVSLISTSVDVWMFSSSSKEAGALHISWGSTQFSNSMSLGLPGSSSTSSKSSAFMVVPILTCWEDTVRRAEQSVCPCAHSSADWTLQLAAHSGYIGKLWCPGWYLQMVCQAKIIFLCFGRVGRDINTHNMDTDLYLSWYTLVGNWITQAQTQNGTIQGGTERKYLFKGWVGNNSGSAAFVFLLPMNSLSVS